MLLKQVNAKLQYVCSGPTSYKLMSLIMRMSSFQWGLHWHSGQEGRVMVVQLAAHLQANWLTPIQLNRPQAYMPPSSPHPGLLAVAGTLTDSQIGHQTRLPLWMARAEVINDKCCSLCSPLTLVQRCSVCLRGWCGKLCTLLSRL